MISDKDISQQKEAPNLSEDILARYRVLNEKCEEILKRIRQKKTAQ